jgi:chromosomal replication initiator protein
MTPDRLGYRCIVVRQAAIPSQPEKTLTLRMIKETVAGVTRASIHDLDGPYRRADLARARMIYYWVARRLTSKGMPLIGHYCGGRDHSTVSYGFLRVERDRLAFEPELSRVMAVLKAEAF